MTGVSNLKARAALLVVGLLVTLVVLALSACGGEGSAQEEAKARPLPLYPPEALSPGEYHSVKFKPPLSFEVSEGWSITENQVSDFIELTQQGEIDSLRGSASRRVADVTISYRAAVQSDGASPSAKSCQPTGGSSKLAF
jgi:hypothetical protein